MRSIASRLFLRCSGCVVTFPFCLVVAWSWALNANEVQGSDSVAEARQHAIEAIGDVPWYHVEEKRIRPINVRSQQDDSAHRKSRWVAKEKTKSNALQRFWDWLTSWAPSFSSGSGFSVFFSWALLILFIVALIALVVYAFQIAETQSQGHGLVKENRGKPAEKLVDRMEHLPTEIGPQANTDLRGEAERLIKEGHFDRAIICLFGHQLLQLDLCHLIRLTRGKTNHQYIREASANVSAAATLRETVQTFETSFFGKYPVSKERMESLWELNLKLEHALAVSQQGVT